jgi:hypothetical protein
LFSNQSPFVFAQIQVSHRKAPKKNRIISKNATCMMCSSPTCGARSKTAATRRPETMMSATASRVTTTRDDYHHEGKSRSPQLLARDINMLEIKLFLACGAKTNGSTGFRHGKWPSFLSLHLMQYFLPVVARALQKSGILRHKNLQQNIAFPHSLPYPPH